jgi:hypothetical protein
MSVFHSLMSARQPNRNKDTMTTANTYKSLQATRGDRSSSAARITSFGSACLSWSVATLPATKAHTMKTIIRKIFVAVCLITISILFANCAIASTNDIAGVIETNTLKLSERSAKMLLEVVSKEQDETITLMFRVMAQYSKTPAQADGWEMVALPQLQGGTKVSISDIIKKYGEPTIRKTMQTKPKNATDKVVDLDVYNFDNGALLTCSRGSDDVHGLLEPEAWLIIGIRKKAEEALAQGK